MSVLLATCDNTDNGQVSDFTFGLPGGATINGIEVVAEMAEGSSSGNIGTQFSLSWNDGTSWTAVKSATVDGTTDTNYTLGGSADTWGRSWTTGELANGTFRLKLDSVVGAFALTTAIPVIVAGLGIGAYFVRVLTIYFVEKKTLDTLLYLEHGAHWAIFGLAASMFASLVWHVPEIITGGIGLAFVLAAYYSSLRKNGG